MKKIIYCLLVSLFVLGLGSCSTDSETLTSQSSQGTNTNYRIVVNVTKGNTRANEKTGWEKGDVIRGYVDGKGWMSLTYEGDDYWDANMHYGGIQRDTCEVHAYYGDTPEGYIYTDEGTFMRSNNVIFINLNMNKRPNARITVKGVKQDFLVAGLHALNNLTDAWDMTFSDTLRNVGPAEYDEQTQTAVFYGLVAPTASQTKILLYNAGGVGYSRIYNKVMKGGESVVLNGPNSSEANLWTKHTLVKTITLNQSRINTYIDETHDLVATMAPEDAENGELKWTSSNTDVATVDNNGHVKVVGAGEALITVSTTDGTCSTCCAINSTYHAFVLFGNVMSSQGSGVLDASFWCYTYDVLVHLKKIYMYEYTTGKEYLLYTTPDEETDKRNHDVTLNFSNLPAGDYKLKAVYEYNGKEYAVYSYAKEIK